MPPFSGPLKADAPDSPRQGVRLIMILLVLSSWLVLGLWVTSERQRAIEAKEASLRQVTLSVAEQTLRLFKLDEMSLVSASDWLRQNPEDYPGENAEFIELIGRLRRLTGGLLIYRFVDPDGNLYPIPTISRSPVGNVAARENILVQRKPETRGFYISDPVISPADGKWAVPTTFPIPTGNNRVSVISGVVDLGKMTQIFEGQRLQPQGSITLVKSTGVTLFRAPMIESSVGRSIAETKDFTEHFNVAERGIYHINGAFDGVARIVSFEKLHDYGLIVATTDTLDDALADWRRETWAIGAYAGIATLVAAFLIHRFLTAANIAEEALRSREREISSILETSSVGILFMDRDSRIIRANASLAEMLMCPVGALIGSRYIDYIAPTDRDSAAARIAEHFDGLRVATPHDRLYFRRDGTTFLGHIASRRMVDDTGTPRGLVAIISDITERKLIEDSLAQRTSQLAASNSELEQFAYVASHDLREPLRMISSYLELLLQRYGKFLDSDGHEFLAFARDGAKRMDQLVLGLLDLSRVDRRGTPLEAIPLARTIDTALINLHRLIGETGAVIDVSDATKQITVIGDLVQLTSLFQNLIANGIKYRAEGVTPQIKIEALGSEGFWEIRVADNGIGIAPENHDRVFGIFQRLHTREKYEGTGIGLAICKKIVECHGGRIWVQSNPGGGSIFCVTLRDAGTAA